MAEPCRSCQAPILYLVDGQFRVPVDPERAADGDLAVWGDQVHHTSERPAWRRHHCTTAPPPELEEEADG